MSNNITRNTRLAKEYKNIITNKIENISAGMIDDDITHWQAIIIGPLETPFENELLKLDIKFPDEYPFKPPIVKFITSVWHPNVGSNGNICLDILKDNWSPTLVTSKVLLSICSLLSDPNTKDPLNGTAAREYDNDRNKYVQNVKKYLKKK